MHGDHHITLWHTHAVRGPIWCWEVKCDREQMSDKRMQCMAVCAHLHGIASSIVRSCIVLLLHALAGCCRHSFAQDQWVQENNSHGRQLGCAPHTCAHTHTYVHTHKRAHAHMRTHVTRALDCAPLLRAGPAGAGVLRPGVPSWCVRPGGIHGRHWP